MDVLPPCVHVMHFAQVGLGLGQTRHSDAPDSSEPGRKGISCERTFANMTEKAAMEQMVREPCALGLHCGVENSTPRWRPSLQRCRSVVETDSLSSPVKPLCVP